jgi:hypothetical protein
MNIEREAAMTMVARHSPDHVESCSALTNALVPPDIKKSSVK